jgi:hypothetical protein
MVNRTIKCPKWEMNYQVSKWRIELSSVLNGEYKHQVIKCPKWEIDLSSVLNGGELSSILNGLSNILNNIIELVNSQKISLFLNGIIIN